VEAESDVELDEESRVMMFRGVRELLFNVVKHGRVANATVQVRRLADGRAQVVVSDRGVGFDPETLRAWDGGTSHSFGLLSLRERLEHLGGRVEVESAPGHGASFTIVGPPPGPGSPGAQTDRTAARRTTATRKRTGVRPGRPVRGRKR
jgi:signal transduction histidine kinase